MEPSDLQLSDIVAAGLRRDPEFWALKHAIKSMIVDHARVYQEAPKPALVQELISAHLRPGADDGTGGGTLLAGTAVIDNEVHRRTKESTARHGRELPVEIARCLGAAAVALPSAREPLICMRRQQSAWRRKLVKRLNRIAKTASGMAMATPRLADVSAVRWQALVEQITEAPLDLSM